MRVFDWKRVRSSVTALWFCVGLLIVTGIVMGLVAYIGFADGRADAGMGPTGLFMTILIISIIIPTIILILMFKRAPRYGTIIEEDQDGIIPLRKICEMTGYSRFKVTWDLRYLMAVHVLRGVEFDRENDLLRVPRDENGAVAAGEDFIEVICATCGAKATVRRHGSAKCSYCGSYLRRRDDR